MLKFNQRLIEESYLYETLTYSVDPDSAIFHLDTKFANDEYNLNFLVRNENIYCKFLSNKNKLTESQFYNFLNFINFLGYRPLSYISYNKDKTGYKHFSYNEETVKYLTTKIGECIFALTIEPRPFVS